MSGKKGLGRGLDALIPAGMTPVEEGVSSRSEGEERIHLCRLEEIHVGRFQPRQKIDPAKIAELASSIRTQGVLQPLLVRPRKQGGYDLIAGERRLRAAQSLGLETVPVVVKDVDERRALELALVENLQREDLNPIEEAQAYRRLLTEFDYTQEQLAERVGRDRTTISNLLRLLSLPEDIIEDIREGRLSAGHGRALLAAGSEAAVRRLRDAVINEGLSVREVERRAVGERERRKGSRKKRKEVGEEEIFLREMEERLMRSLGAKVSIMRKKKGGQINVYFYSEEELERLFRRLGG